MKVIGYLIAVIGLVIMVFGAGGFGTSLPIDPWIVNIAGMVFVALGVVLVIISGGGAGASGYQGKRKSKSGGKIGDLPVYEGDNIVAYRRD